MDQQGKPGSVLTLIKGWLPEPAIFSFIFHSTFSKETG